MPRKTASSAAEKPKDLEFVSKTGVVLTEPEEAGKYEALALDAQINTKIAECSEQLVRAYLELGDSLARMRESKGFKELGFDSWDSYLSSKQEFGRSYLIYICKLGQAKTLGLHIDESMSATKLIEFAKKTSPEKIGPLIDATWEEVKDKSVKETDSYLTEWVAKHPKEFGRAKKGSKAGRKPDTYTQKLEKQYEKLTAKQRKDYLAQMVQFLTARGFNLVESDS